LSLISFGMTTWPLSETLVMSMMGSSAIGNGGFGHSGP
jgi:hypothetical protein